jgi:Raf kinase inhibitor-like YbhB/YbcL family protein
MEYYRQAYYPPYPFTVMRTWLSQILPFVLLSLICAAGCTAPSPSSASPSSVQTVTLPPASAISSGTLALHVDSLDPGSTLPDTYTCKGVSESPEVSWSGIPAGTKSLVLIFDDPDASKGTFTHWLVYNIPPVSGSMSRAQPNQKVLENGAQQGDSSAGSRGYYPPCPPVGTTHRYVFRLYAVDMDISQPAASRESIDWAMSGHTLDKTEFVTSFKR